MDERTKDERDRDERVRAEKARTKSWSVSLDGAKEDAKVTAGQQVDKHVVDGNMNHTHKVAVLSLINALPGSHVFGTISGEADGTSGRIRADISSHDGPSTVKTRQEQEAYNNMTREEQIADDKAKQAARDAETERLRKEQEERNKTA
jgi:hypothetical protein